MQSLASLALGQKAKVLKVVGENSSLRRRLLDMGLTPNTELEVVRVAPLGDPLVLNLRGYALTLRKEDAKLIEIEAC